MAKRKHRIRNHFKRLGFTNRLAIYILLFLAFGLAGGFYLAIKCIGMDYTGSLYCWTIVFTPIGTACSIVLSRGISYALAKANEFKINDYNEPTI